VEKITLALPDAKIKEEIRLSWRHKLGTQSLGRLEEMVVDYGGMIGSVPQKIKAALLIMCGDHGIAKYGVSAFNQAVTYQMIQGYMRDTAGANVFARHSGARVVVVDAGTAADLKAYAQVRHYKVAPGTNDFTQGPAMTSQQAQQALKVGMEAAEEQMARGYNLLLTGEMGIGNTTSTAAIVAAFFGLPPEETVGRGSGINDERLQIKRQVVAAGLAKNKPKAGDGLDILIKLGGYEHAALAGMMIGGALKRVPTIIDGVNATAAALIACSLVPDCKNYLFCSHLSAEQSHQKMLAYLGLKPVVDAQMRLGEGTGAALALNLLRLSLGTYHDLGW
jgi:nicotinate-nucleotide--dimethylbenzimidazole phosphoribosyltransferase